MEATVLIVGGAGVFGSRLAERLAQSSDCNILIGGRSLTRAEEAIATLSARKLRATLKTWVMDRARVTPEDLRRSGATIVVDAAGPFQGHDARLAEASIAAGCHFIDLADARDYVAAFHDLHEAARSAGVLAVCGASSTPALSNAALDALTTDMARPEAVDVYISPGNRAPRGLSVMQAILSYAGRPVQVRESGSTRNRPGWSMLHRRRLRGLGTRWFSLCETPDLDLIPARFPTVRRARFFAGLELAVLHVGLWVLSLAVRARLIDSLAPCASALLAIARRFEHRGTDRGGMLVEVQGWRDDGNRFSRQWGLIAEAGDGPYVPTLPALALIRKLLAGRETWRGARACVGLLTLEEIVAEFQGLRIETYREATCLQPLFIRALGPAFDVLPPAVRELHQPPGPSLFAGRARIDGASNRAGAWIARLFGFPSPAGDVPVRVAIEPRERSEVWRRRFGTSGFASTLAIEPGTRKLTERFGAIRFVLHVDAHRSGIDMRIESAKLGPIPLPRFAVPWTRARESDAAGRFTFDVEIGLHGLGRLVRYQGWLTHEARLDA